ncbi:hypothetical protein LC612_43155 [Nostoc sp. CHAB 5834]|nr:hypothetical protein [Nostoc sp. CHAB 5834]
MILHEVSSLVRRAPNGDVWNISTEQGASVLYATVNGQNCRIIVPRSGQSPPQSVFAPAFLTYVATDASDLERWLTTVCNMPSQPDVPVVNAI